MAVYPVQVVLDFARKLKTVLGLVPVPDLQVDTKLQPVLIANPPEIPASVTLNLPPGVAIPVSTGLVRTIPNIEDPIALAYFTEQETTLALATNAGHEYSLPATTLNIANKFIRMSFSFETICNFAPAGIGVTVKFKVPTSQGTAFEDMMYLVTKGIGNFGGNQILLRAEASIDFKWDHPENPNALLVDLTNFSPNNARLSAPVIYCLLTEIGKDIS